MWPYKMAYAVKEERKAVAKREQSKILGCIIGYHTAFLSAAKIRKFID